MHCRVYRGNVFLGEVEATPICGDDFCATCGVCLECFAELTCRPNERGSHVWIKDIESLDSEDRRRFEDVLRRAGHAPDDLAIMSAVELIARLAEFPGGRWEYTVPDLTAHSGTFTATLNTQLGSSHTGEGKTLAEALGVALRKAKDATL